MSCTRFAAGRADSRGAISTGASKPPEARHHCGVVSELAVIGEPVNRVLEIDLDSDEVTLTLYDLPSTSF
jgi:hypothetical protein